jgi:hypothetical protein
MYTQILQPQPSSSWVSQTGHSATHPTKYSLLVPSLQIKPFWPWRKLHTKAEGEKNQMHPHLHYYELLESKVKRMLRRLIWRMIQVFKKMRKSKAVTLPNAKAEPDVLTNDCVQASNKKQ